MPFDGLPACLPGRRCRCTSARHHPPMAICTTVPLSTATTCAKRCGAPTGWFGELFARIVCITALPRLHCTNLACPWFVGLQAGARVVSASYGGSDSSQIEYDAIAELRQAGVLFVAAAGNGRFPNYYCCFPRCAPCTILFQHLERWSPHHMPSRCLFWPTKGALLPIQTAPTGHVPCCRGQ